MLVRLLFLAAMVDHHSQTSGTVQTLRSGTKVLFKKTTAAQQPAFCLNVNVRLSTLISIFYAWLLGDHSALAQ